MFRISHLTKSYRIENRRHYVFRDVTLDIPEGANIGIIGPNGAGKSTLLRIMGGIDYPDSGSIQTSYSISWPLGLKGGFVPHISGRENCRMVCNLYNLRPADIRIKLEQIKELSGIGDYFEEPVSYYSSGMGSRLGFALSMAFDFDYFLIDEITSVGDAQFRVLAKQALREKAKRSKVIMVSHNMSDIKTFCDIAILIKDGRLTLFRDLDEAIEAYLPKSQEDPEAELMLKKRAQLDSIHVEHYKDNPELVALRREVGNQLEELEEKLSTPGAHSTLEDDEFYLKHARLRYNLGDRLQALYLLDLALAANEMMLPALVFQAQICNELGKKRKERAAVEKVLELDPLHPQANMRLAQFLIEEENYPAALEATLTSIRVIPKHAPAWYRLSQIYYLMEQWDDALDAIIKAIRINPDPPHFHRHLSSVLLAVKAHEPAIDARIRAIEAQLHTKPPTAPEKLLTQLSEQIDALDSTIEI